MIKFKQFAKYFLIMLLFSFSVGLLLPENMTIPVKNATSADWNHNTFWYEPWGSSVVHKGIDIFGKKGTTVIPATTGIVLYRGQLKKGGNVVAVLGPKWRIHYYAHLESINVNFASLVNQTDKIGTLGDSGNAKGKAPHIHYSILSLIPLPWLATTETQGWKKMFYLDPHSKLL